MSAPLERFGERLSRLRRAKGWRQKELARRVGIKATQVSKYERGAYEPKLSVLGRIAAVLGVSADYLLTGKEVAEPDPLAALWPVVAGFPRELRSRLAALLETVVKAHYLLDANTAAREPRQLAAGGSQKGPRQRMPRPMRSGRRSK